jgi:hypothetical protein
MEKTSDSGTSASLLQRGLAVVVLVVAAYLLLRVVIGVISAVAWVVVAVAAVVGVLWALNTLR